MKLNRIIRNALKRQGVTAEKIEAALTSLKAPNIRLKRDMIRRIEDMLTNEGLAVVTRKQVSSWKSYAARKANVSHLAGSLAKARAAKAAKAKAKTPAEISAALK